MTPNDAGSCEWLASEIVNSHLIERGVLDPIVTEFQTGHPYADATALAEDLVRQGYLTTFQATRLLEGQGRGLVLGPYALVDTIGTGSMGTVYKALGKADRCAYAVKVLPVRSRWNVRQARKHLQAIPNEPHPGVVPFLDVGTSAGMHYLVWPFVEGDTLEQVVRREGLMPPARAALVGLQLAHALQWCERNRLYHGALKPSNVMIGDDGQAQLLDFGVGPILAECDDASVVDTLSEATALCSLLDCTAPECLTDPTKRSVRADQYSLGCTLYYSLTGRTPFPDGTAVEKLLAHQSKDPVPVTTLNPGVTTALSAVVDRLMQKAPQARYPRTDDLINALVPLARLSAVYLPPDQSPSPFLPARGPTSTPMRRGPSLLTAVQTRLTPPPPPSSKSTPPLAMTPVPRTGRGLSGLTPHPSAPISDPNGPTGAGAVVPPYQPPAGLHAPPLSVDLPQTPPPQQSLWRWLVRTFAVWRPTSDQVACTLLTPSGVIPGETVAVQVVLHHVDRTGQAQVLPDWRGSVALPTLLGRGETVGLHLAFHDLDVSKPTGQIEWLGYSAATLIGVRLPPGWPPGHPLQGTLTIGWQQRPVAQLEFALPVGAPQGAQ